MQEDSTQTSVQAINCTDFLEKYGDSIFNSSAQAQAFREAFPQEEPSDFLCPDTASFILEGQTISKMRSFYGFFFQISSAEGTDVSDADFQGTNNFDQSLKIDS